MQLVKSYLRRNKIAPLSKDEVFELIPKAQAGCQQSKDKLIIHNLAMVIQFAGRYAWAVSETIGFEDIFQQGIFGLMRAIEKFDITRNLAFSTYSTIWIRQAMGRYIQDHRGPVRIPSYLQELRSKYNKIKRDDTPHNNDFYMRLIANQNDSTVANLKYSITSGDKRIDAPNDEGETCDDLESIVDENEINVNLLDFQVMIAKIGGRDKDVIERRLQGWTLSEIAEEMDLSRERIRQLEDSVILKLRAMVTSVNGGEVFKMREKLEDQFKQHLTEIIRHKKIKYPIKIDSSKRYSPIIGVCSECMFEALRLPENMSKCQQGQPNWVTASCDVCGKIKPCAAPKDFMWPVFVISSGKELI